MNAQPVAEIRPSPIAGTWYAGNAAQLRRQVEGYIAEAKLPTLEGEVVGVIAPHAGHRYSGRTAGAAFASVQGRHFRLVVVLSPMHAVYSGHFLTSAHRAYATPLGTLPIDLGTLAELDAALQTDHLRMERVANDQEHSLEIELPFLQCALQGEFQLLPIMLRTTSMEMIHKFGLALAEVLKGKDALLVASTDLSHFYTEVQANALDNEMLRRIAAFAPEQVFEAERSGAGYACGVGAVGAALWAARELGADQVQILHHSTSGDASGDRTSVVGYGAAAILRTKSHL